MAPCISATFANLLKINLNEKFSGLEQVHFLSVATILDPRFAVERLAQEPVCQSY